MNIFLLRGLIREAGHWGHFIPTLKEFFPGSNIYCLEPAGVGMRYQEESPTSIKDIMESMRGQFLQNKGEKNMLISISLGGMIAAQWSQDYPDDFQEMVIINSSFKNLSPLYERVKPRSILTFFRVMLTPNKEKREEIIVKMVSNDKSKHPRITQEWIDIARSHPVSSRNGLRQLWAAAHFSTKLSAPKARVLVMASPKDRLCSSRCSEKLAKKWQTDILFHAWAGHSLTEDDPKWCADQIKKWTQL